MSGYRDSEAVEAIRDQQDQQAPVPASDAAVTEGEGEGVSSTKTETGEALPNDKGVRVRGKSKGLSTILCCLCGRPIQPNGETCIGNVA